jgi:small subunit ribosomal protein S17
MSETTTSTVAASSASRGNRKERIGEVLSSKMAKTIVVRVERRFPHPQFKKVVTSYKKFYAHDEKSEAKPGDRVRIQETRPLSKMKRWRLVEVVERNLEPARVTG